MCVCIVSLQCAHLAEKAIAWTDGARWGRKEKKTNQPASFLSRFTIVVLWKKLRVTHNSSHVCYKGKYTAILAVLIVGSFVVPMVSTKSVFSFHSADTNSSLSPPIVLTNINQKSNKWKIYTGAILLVCARWRLDWQILCQGRSRAAPGAQEEGLVLNGWQCVIMLVITVESRLLTNGI